MYFFTRLNKISRFVSLISIQCIALRGVKLLFIEITFVHQKPFFRHLTKCLGRIYDKLAAERFNIHPMSVMFSFTRAAQNNRKDTCDYGSMEVSRHFCDSWSKEVNRHFLCSRAYVYFRLSISCRNYIYIYMYMLNDQLKMLVFVIIYTLIDKLRLLLLYISDPSYLFNQSTVFQSLE